jgi:rare lipoprotein A (peptidoglycan hydrolase)
VVGGAVVAGGVHAVVGGTVEAGSDQVDRGCVVAAAVAGAVAAVAPGHSESGLATYYAHNPAGCASRTVPRGTTVTVTASNGASITCTVDDYGPFGDGRIIDLSEQGFAKLASLGTGVISVTVTW